MHARPEPILTGETEVGLTGTDRIALESRADGYWVRHLWTPAQAREVAGQLLYWAALAEQIQEQRS